MSLQAATLAHAAGLLVIAPRSPRALGSRACQARPGSVVQSCAALAVSAREAAALTRSGRFDYVVVRLTSLSQLRLLRGIRAEYTRLVALLSVGQNVEQAVRVAVTYSSKNPTWTSASRARKPKPPWAGRSRRSPASGGRVPPMDRHPGSRQPRRVGCQREVGDAHLVCLQRQCPRRHLRRVWERRPDSPVDRPEHHALGFELGSTYRFQVDARDTASNVSRKAELTIATLACATGVDGGGVPGGGVDALPPSTPLGVAVSAASQTSVAIRGLPQATTSPSPVTACTATESRSARTTLTAYTFSGLTARRPTCSQSKPSTQPATALSDRRSAPRPRPAALGAMGWRRRVPPGWFSPPPRQRASHFRGLPRSTTSEWPATATTATEPLLDPARVCRRRSAGFRVGLPTPSRSTPPTRRETTPTDRACSPRRVHARRLRMGWRRRCRVGWWLVRCRGRVCRCRGMRRLTTWVWLVMGCIAVGACWVRRRVVPIRFPGWPVGRVMRLRSMRMTLLGIVPGRRLVRLRRALVRRRRRRLRVVRGCICPRAVRIRARVRRRRRAAASIVPMTWPSPVRRCRWRAGITTVVRSRGARALM